MPIGYPSATADGTDCFQARFWTFEATSGAQALDNVDGILTAQGSVESVRGDEHVKKRARKPSQK